MTPAMYEGVKHKDLATGLVTALGNTGLGYYTRKPWNPPGEYVCGGKGGGRLCV